MLIRIGISALSLVLFAMHVQGSPRFEIIDRIENYLYDVRVRLTMPGTIDERVVIVDIDEASQPEPGQWPWPRDTLAEVLDSHEHLRRIYYHLLKPVLTGELQCSGCDRLNIRPLRGQGMLSVPAFPETSL